MLSNKFLIDKSVLLIFFLIQMKYTMVGYVTLILLIKWNGSAELFYSSMLAFDVLIFNGTTKLISIDIQRILHTS